MRWIAACAILSIIGCSGSGGDSPQKQAPPPPIVNLVVDANRNGLLELGPNTDELSEESWTASAGAVFLVNLDDDDSDRVADNADEIVNGPADDLDLGRIAVQAWSLAGDSAVGTLTFDQGSRAFVRVFRRDAAGWKKLDLATPLVLDSADLRGGVVLGIEALDFVRTAAQPWQGLVNVTLTVADEKGEIGNDAVQLRAAPWLMNHNLRPFDTVYSSEFSSQFTQTLGAVLEEVGVGYQTYPDDYGAGTEDIWYEDWFQTGWTAMPAIDGNGTAHGMIVFNPRPWGRAPGEEPVKFLRERLLGPDRAVAVLYDEATQLGKGDTYDSHGNHEALPPHPGSPVGRLLLGSGILQTTRDFYAAQRVQPPIYLKTSWLYVGHMDEVYGAVRAATPKGFKMIENSPALCRQLFSEWEAQGNGAAPVFQGKYDPYDKKPWETTLAEVNADAVLMGWNQEAQTEIDAMRDQLIAEAGLGDDDFIQVPVLYEEIDNGKIAWLPDTANIRAIDRGNVVIFATTFGPIIQGEDAFKKHLETSLTDPKRALGADGQGIEVRFADSWSYHVLLGDVHCATNWSALPTTEEVKWWEALP